MIPVFRNPSTRSDETFLTQWETGVTFEFYADAIGSVTVAMSTPNRPDALSVPCTMENGLWKCKIPDIILQDCGIIKMHFADTTPEGGVRVFDRAEVPIRGRKRPIDYVLEDSDDYMNLILYTTKAEALVRDLLTQIDLFEMRFSSVLVGADATFQQARRELLQAVTETIEYAKIEGLPTSDELEDFKTVLSDYNEIASALSVTKGRITAEPDFAYTRPRVRQSGNVVCVSFSIQSRDEGMPTSYEVIGHISGVALPEQSGSDLNSCVDFAAVDQDGRSGRGQLFPDGHMQLRMSEATSTLVSVNFSYIV